jgi:myosin heavy subunit
MMRRLLAAFVALSLALLPAQADPALSRQELARSKFQELTDRMQRLMTVLQSAAPDDAGLLGAGLQYVREAKIHEDLARIGKLLEKEGWDEALAEMTQVRDELTRLYEILQNRSLDLTDLLERIATLEQFRDQVDQLARQQGEHKEASAKSEALQKQLAALEAQQRKAEQLLAQQRELQAATQQLGAQPEAAAAREAAERQTELQRQTEQLQKDVQALEAAAPAEANPSKPSESAGAAAQAMGKAAGELGQQRGEPATNQQSQAQQALQRTVDELAKMAEDARRELLKLPFEDQAKRQEATQQATDKLAQDMQKAEQGENGAGEATPGKSKVEQSVPKQRAAAGQLKEFKNAKQKQQDAKEDLEAAREELDEALAQLRQQLQDEVLRALEERFTAMLQKQQDLSAETKTLDTTRQNVLTADGALPSSLASRIQAVATGEGDLEVEATDALKVLAEEGTTAVFPEMIEELRDQLRAVATACRGNRTDAALQTQQQDVEATLTLLIDALRKTIERKESGH